MNPGAATAFNPNYLDESVIIQALAHGEHAPVLQAYFGAEAYTELTALAQRALAQPTDKQAPCVYVLPGLLGSRLGIHTRRQTEVLWLDPTAVIAGKLKQLAIGRRRSIRPLGVMLPGYLKLKLSLQAGGFQVRLYPYDWRRSVRELGRQLAEDLLHESAREVMLVAHSMGGLVARAALKQAGTAKVTRVIQLGTPNQGAFALVQALRGCYPTVRKLGAVDHFHSAEALTQQVFRSYYSFYEMLPPKSFSPGIDLFDVRQWPQDTLTPPAERLKLGRPLPRHLSIADRRCHVIAGVDQATVCGLHRQHNEFIFEYRQAGDGTVPLALAQWDGAQHWYVAEAHGLLPRNTQVCQAVIDLLQTETTQLLTNQYQPTDPSSFTRSESELRALLNGKVRWDQLPMNERRDLLEPVISPTFSALCEA
ncbi:MAG: alpha/beta fold hydrolase [Steroidobacteraceae bacterium]